MDWKKFFINTLAGLLVAITAGVVVWLLTRSEPLKEGVVYSISESGSFGAGENKISYFKLVVRNKGQEKSSNVKVRIKDRSDAQVSNFDIKKSKSDPEVTGVVAKSGEISFLIPKFLPSEFVSLSVLYKSPKNIDPSIIVTTDTGLGFEDQELGSDRLIDNLGTFQLFLLFLALAAWVIGSNFFIKKFFNLTNLRFFLPSRNNSGFLLLHSQMFDLAEETLESAIKSGAVGPIQMSNLAAVKNYLGKKDQSTSLMAISSHWAKTKCLTEN